MDQQQIEIIQIRGARKHVFGVIQLLYEFFN